MTRPLAGRRAFEAAGRRAYSRGLPAPTYAKMKHLPAWAADAVLHGYYCQMPHRLSGAVRRIYLGAT